MNLSALGGSTPLVNGFNAGLSPQGDTATQINAMATTVVQSLNVSQLSSVQIKGLTTALQKMTALQIAGVISQGESVMSAQQFFLLSATEVSALTTTEIAALTSTQASGLNASGFKGMNASQLAAFSPADVAGFNAPQKSAFSAAVGGLSGAQLATLSATAIVSLAAEVSSSASVAAAITATQAAALTTTQVASLTTTELNAMSKAAIGALKVSALTTTQMQGLTTALTLMTATEFAALSATQAAQLTATQIKSLAATDFAAATATEMGALTASAVAALSSADVGALSGAAFAALGAKAASLTTTALAGLTSTDVAAMTRTEIGALNASQLSAIPAKLAATLSATQANAIATTALAGLTSTALNGLGATVLAALDTTHVQALTTTELNALTTTNYNAINVAEFASAQVSALRASALGKMSTTTFDQIVAPNIGALSVSDISSVTTTELGSLTSTQAGNLTSAQLAAMSGAQLAALPGAGKGLTVMQDVAAQEQSGSISYAGVLKVLQDQAASAMNSTKFAGLQQFAKAVDAGSIKATAYVRQMLDNVVEGNSTNVFWNGGASTASVLGNLSGTSSQTQFNELIGKWFLGTDHPATNVGATGTGSNVASSYQDESSMPLFGSNGPQYTDVNQGNVGDCYFMSALAVTAKNDPSLIKNMIQSNGNGTYSVDFQVNGKDDYVTVDSQLPVMSSASWANGSNLEFANGNTLWAPLVEKAYAELVEQSAVTPGMSLGKNGDSYADIAGGDGNGITAITGQQTTMTVDSGGSSISSLSSQLSAAMSKGQDVLMGTGNSAGGNLVSDHMFEVVGFNASTNTVTLQNPWNTAVGSSASQKMNFTMTLQQLAAYSPQFFFAQGTAATA